MHRIGCLFRSIVHWLVQFQGLIAGCSILIMTVMVSLDIMARVLFNESSKFSTEFTSYLMVIAVSFGLAYTLQEGAHITVDIVTVKLPRHMRKWAQAIAAVISLIFVVILLWLTWQQFMVSLRLNTLSGSAVDVPLWPIQLFIPLGLLLTALLLLCNIYDAYQSLSQQDDTLTKNEGGLLDL